MHVQVTMRQSVAWELALRNIRSAEVRFTRPALLRCLLFPRPLQPVAPAAKALTNTSLAAQAAKVEEELRADSGVEVIRDLRLSVKPIRRRARLVYFPAYVIRYTFGEHFNTAGERRPNKHLAIVGGIGVPPTCLASNLLVPAAIALSAEGTCCFFHSTKGVY